MKSLPAKKSDKAPKKLLVVRTGVSGGIRTGGYIKP